MSTNTPDSLIQTATRSYHESPTPQAAEAVEHLKARFNPVVRVQGSFSHSDCQTLGALIRETAKGFSYKCATTGKTKSVKKTRKPRYAGEGQRTAHLVACTTCLDHVATIRDANHCMHGKHRAHGNCETCMSM